MCADSRVPHSVISAATSQDRGVNAGDRKQYNHASSTKPRPQPISAILASRSLTLIIHTRVSGSQDGAKADERRHDTGHDRDSARRAIARSKPPKIRA